MTCAVRGFQERRRRSTANRRTGNVFKRRNEQHLAARCWTLGSCESNEHDDPEVKEDDAAHEFQDRIIIAIPATLER